MTVMVAAPIAPVATAPVLSTVSLVIVGVTLLVVLGCALLHYETFVLLTRGLARMKGGRRRRILVLVLALAALHIVEIWVFGVAYWLLLAEPGYGAIHGASPSAFLDHVYFSAVVFTTLGLGDLVPSGSIRFLVGTEALAGFTLITWSAAFVFLEMERYWRNG